VAAVTLLRRWRLYEMDVRAVHAAVERQLGTTNRANHDSGRIGGVPDLDLELNVEGYVTRTCAPRGSGRAPVAAA
jgi:hypothetical protein